MSHLVLGKEPKHSVIYALLDPYDDPFLLMATQVVRAMGTRQGNVCRRFWIFFFAVLPSLVIFFQA